MKSQIQQIILEAATDMNNLMSSPLPVDKAAHCPLYGDESPMDSISLVSLIAQVEQEIEDEFGVGIILANEKAMSSRNSPFLTVETLTNYTATLIEEAQNG